MAPQPIGITADQWEDANRLLAEVNQGEFNDRLQRDVREQQLQVSLQRDIERSLSNNPEFVANLSVPTVEIQDTVTAQRGDSISTIMGTSDPVAIEAFLRANKLSNSTIYAGRDYVMPGSADYEASSGRLGQSILDQDNRRLADAAAEPDTFFGDLRLAQALGVSMDDIAMQRSGALPQTAGQGLLTMYETQQRLKYAAEIEARSLRAVADIRAARAAGDLSTARSIAEEVSGARNQLRTATQQRLFPGGQFMSETLEQARDFSAMEAKYASANPFDTYESIADAAGRSRGSLKFLTSIGRVGGPAATIFGAGVAGYEIYSASPEDQPRVIFEQGGGVVGGAAGATTGTLLGTGAAVALGGASGPPGWLALLLGLGGGALGGYYGSKIGERTGGNIYRGLTPGQPQSYSTQGKTIEDMMKEIHPYGAD